MLKVVPRLTVVSPDNSVANHLESQGSMDTKIDFGLDTLPHHSHNHVYNYSSRRRPNELQQFLPRLRMANILAVHNRQSCLDNDSSHSLPHFLRFKKSRRAGW